MDRSSIAQTLSHIRDFLEKEAMFLLSAETRASLLQGTAELMAKAASLGDLLYVGLVGGTGVGKSTLINALARREISSPSDRRPFTDRAVVYRHRDAAPGLEKIASLIREPDAVHESDSIRDLVLLDLPDFDSQDAQNRGTVLEIMPALDCAVWVASPEKYADAALYQLVRQTAINQDNFTFVLNKADELMGTQEPHQHQSLKEVLGDFAFRLRHEAGVEQPRLFSVSSLTEYHGKGGDPTLRSEFRRFRDFLMASRTAKEISSIKSINLREETVRLLANLNREVRVDDLAHLANAMEEKRPESADLVSATSLQRTYQERRLSLGLLRFLIHEDASVSPVRMGMRLVARGRGFELDADRCALEQLFRDAVQRARDARQSQAEAVANHADTELILTLSHAEALPPLQDPEALMLQVEKEASASFMANVENHEKASSGLRSTLMRARQKFLLCLPVLMLMVKLAGPEAFARWWEHPSVSGAFGLAVRSSSALFGSEGLTGLLVLLICEGAVVWYLAARRLNRLQREAGSLARVSVLHVQSCWDGVVRQIAENRLEAVRRIQQGIKGLQRLNSLAFAGPAWKNPDIRAKPAEAVTETATIVGKDSPV